MYACIRRLFLLSLLCCNTISIKPMGSVLLDHAVHIAFTLGQAVDLVVDTRYKPRLIDSAEKPFAAGQGLVGMSACMNVVFATAMGFANYTILKSNYYNPLCNLLSWCIATGYMYRQHTKGAFTLQGSEKVFVYGCLSKAPIYISSCLFPRTVHSLFHMRSLLYA